MHTGTSVKGRGLRLSCMKFSQLYANEDVAAEALANASPMRRSACASEARYVSTKDLRLDPVKEYKHAVSKGDLLHDVNRPPQQEASRALLRVPSRAHVRSRSQPIRTSILLAKFAKCELHNHQRVC